MRNSMKLLPALLLGSVLGGCSMAGTGDYFADEYGNQHSWGQTGQYDQSNCWQPEVQSHQQVVAQPAQTACGQGNYIQPNFVPNFAHTTVAQPTYTQPTYAQPTYAQPNYAQAPTYVQPTYVQPNYGQAAYIPPSVGVNRSGLRGPRQVSDNYFYGTLGGVNYDLGEDIYGLQGRVGYQFNRFLGAEAEGSFGVVDDTDPLTVAGGAIVDQEVNVDSSVAAFGVVRYPLFGKLSGLSRAGYHHTNLSVNLTDAAGVETGTDFNTDGFAYGTGLEYAFDPKTSVRADYTRYDFDGPDAESLSLAVARKF